MYQSINSLSSSLSIPIFQQVYDPAKGNGLNAHVYRERSTSLGEMIKQRNSDLSITRTSFDMSLRKRSLMNIFCYSGSGGNSLSPENPGLCGILDSEICIRNRSNDLVKSRVKAQRTKTKEAKPQKYLEA